MRERGEEPRHDAATPIITAPPATTARTVPISEATTPDSNAPSSFEALMKTHSTALTRPCSSGGVTSEHRRRADVHADHVDEAGDRERGERERQRLRQAEDDHHRPEGRDDDEQRRAGAVAERAAREDETREERSDRRRGSQQRRAPIGPTWRIVSANTGASAIESPKQHREEVERDRAEEHARLDDEADAGDRFFHVGSIARRGRSHRLDAEDGDEGDAGTARRR